MIANDYQTVFIIIYNVDIMKRLFKILSLIIAPIYIMSCSGSDYVTVERESIYGPLGPYFKVVDREYKIVDGVINIEFERVAGGMPEPWEEGIDVGYTDNCIEPGITVEFLDTDGDILEKSQTSVVFNDDELDALVYLDINESVSIPFDVSNKKIKSFKASSSFKYHEPVKKAETAIQEVENIQKEIDEVYDEMEKEIKDVYDEVEKEVVEAYKEVVKDVFDLF